MVNNGLNTYDWTGWKTILEELEPYGAKLIAVSKTKPLDQIEELFRLGQLDFGENRVQELIDKHESCIRNGIQWHMIGHLQTNKVKYIAPFVHMIHSVDSMKLMKEINKHAIKNERKIPVLLQFWIAKESAKFGFDPNDIDDLIHTNLMESFQNLTFSGVMGMATFTDDVDLIRSEFRSLHQIFSKLKSQVFGDSPEFKEISMGMSGDYRIALEEGSSMVRVGSKIFGSRN